VGRTVPLDSARAGDLVLFTGTDSTERHVGHMGIVTDNKDGQVEFIHSTSGKAFGVTITPMSRYYIGRYVRTARIFAQNDK
jgi:cell wall-associated NlpC family hydrolase